jgi:hypothetical protein
VEDPAAVYYGAGLQRAEVSALPIAAEGRVSAPRMRKAPPRYKPRGELFQPFPNGMVSGYPLARPVLEKFRAEVPHEDAIRYSMLFAVSTIRVRIEAAEASFDCFVKLYEARKRMQLKPREKVFPPISQITKCFSALRNAKARQFHHVSDYAPVFHKAMVETGLRDRALRRYLAQQTDLPEGLGLAKLSFTLLLLGQDCMCMDTRILTRMFGSWEAAEQVQSGWGKTPKGRISDLGLARYEAVEDSFITGNMFYDPTDPIGRARAQWISWEPLGEPPRPSEHGVWLKVAERIAFGGTRLREGERLLSVDDVARLPVGSLLWWDGQALVVVPGGLAPVSVLPERADSRAPDGEPPASFGGPFTLIADGKGKLPTHGTAQAKVMAWWNAHRGPSGSRTR